MSIRPATDLFESESLPPLLLYGLPRPRPCRALRADWSLKSGDILSCLALILGFTGRLGGAANRAYNEVKQELVQKLSQKGVSRNQSFEATGVLFERREEFIAEICCLIKLIHPYMDYFKDDWALRSMIWSAPRLARSRGVRDESPDV